MKKNIIVATFVVASSFCASLQASYVSFEDLTFAVGNYENGANLTGTESTINDPYGPGTGSLVTRTSTISSGVGTVVSATNTYSRKYSGANGTGSLEFDFWGNWAYSKDTDSTTSGFGNQYSSITGSGAGGSSNYLVGFQSGLTFDLSFSAAEDFTGRGLEVTNTTYAHNDMRDGGSFSKKFGGPSGNDEDWFLLTIEGFNSSSSTGTVGFYLADYRFTNNSLDYIVNEWTFVDLSALGSIDELRFSLSSSDTGTFGMNTPAYVALDNIGIVPEPSSAILLLLGCASLSFGRKNHVSKKSLRFR